MLLSGANAVVYGAGGVVGSAVASALARGQTPLSPVMLLPALCSMILHFSRDQVCVTAFLSGNSFSLFSSSTSPTPSASSHPATISSSGYCVMA